MDTSTFAQKIKAKYPAYQNVDDATLVKKFIEKYPEYKSQVNVQSEIGADISQTKQAIGEATNTALNKFEAVNKLQATGQQGSVRSALQKLGIGAGYASNVAGEAIIGAGKALLPQSAETAIQTGVEKTVTPIVQSQPVQNILSKYEELKTVNPKLAQDISSALGFAQLGLDVAGIGETAGLAKTGIKKGVQLAETGVKDIAQAGSDLATGVEKLGTAITPKPEEIMNRVARLTPSDARKFETLAGKSHGQYLKETGNFGTPDEIVKREAEKFVQSMNEADNALASLPGEYKSPSIDIAASELVDKAKRVSAPGVESPILARATELQNKANTTGLTMSEVNELKRLYEKNVKLGYNKLMNADAVERATNIDNALRNWQFGKAKELGFSNLDEINKQTQLSKFMVDKLGNQILGKSGNNAMGLTDWIMVSGGDPTAIGGLLVKKFFSSEKVQSKIAKMLTKEAPSELKTATVNKPINNIGSEVKGTTRSKQSQQLLEGKQLKKASTTVSKKSGIMSSDLSTEAKKYKSAEEFIKAQGKPVYHGTRADFNEFDISKAGQTDRGFAGKGVYFTNDKEIADFFSKRQGDFKTGGRIIEANLNIKNPLIIESNVKNPYKKIQDLLNVKNSDDIPYKAKKLGYDSIIIKDKTPEGRIVDEYVVFDTSIIKTKSQLEEIWEKANKK